MDATGGPVAADTVELVAGFTDEMYGRNLRQSTVRVRRAVLRLVAEFVYPRSLLEVRRADVVEFLASRSIGPDARAAYLSNLSAFYRWAILVRLVDVDPTSSVQRPKLRRRLPRPISSPDLAFAFTLAEPRVGAFLALASYSGLRCWEIAGLDRDDVLDTNRPPLLVVRDGKGGHDRVVPLHPDVLSALRRAELPRRGPLFRKVDGDRLPAHRVSQLGNQYLRELGVPATMHQLRHWFGSEVYRRTRDLRMTQELLGHASPNSTALYTKLFPEDAYEDVAKLSALPDVDVAGGSTASTPRPSREL